MSVHVDYVDTSLSSRTPTRQSQGWKGKDKLECDCQTYTKDQPDEDEDVIESTSRAFEELLSDS